MDRQTQAVAAALTDYVDECVIERGELVNAAKAAIAASDAKYVPELVEALNKIIEMNRQWALDKYGNADEAESLSCVKVAHKAIAKLPEELKK